MSKYNNDENILTKKPVVASHIIVSKYNNDENNYSNIHQSTEEQYTLKQKIKGQKRILREKIANERQKAFNTGKQEEIERTEKKIQDLLTKHDLKEEDLIDKDFIDDKQDIKLTIKKLRDSAFGSNKILNVKQTKKTIQNLLSQNNLSYNDLIKTNDDIERQIEQIYQIVLNNDKATDEDVIKANKQIETILKQGIEKQKQILRKKIANERQKAFNTGKKEEIERVEKEIHDLLAKHDLTEEDLKDDDDDNNSSQSSATGSYTTTQANQ